MKSTFNFGIKITMEATTVGSAFSFEEHIPPPESFFVFVVGNCEGEDWKNSVVVYNTYHNAMFWNLFFFLALAHCIPLHPIWCRISCYVFRSSSRKTRES